MFDVSKLNLDPFCSRTGHAYSEYPYIYTSSSSSDIAGVIRHTFSIFCISAHWQQFKKSIKVPLQISGLSPDPNRGATVGVAVK